MTEAGRARFLKARIARPSPPYISNRNTPAFEICRNSNKTHPILISSGNITPRVAVRFASPRSVFGAYLKIQIPVISNRK